MDWYDEDMITPEEQDFINLYGDEEERFYYPERFDNVTGLRI